jgi:hypothetical protein
MPKGAASLLKIVKVIAVLKGQMKTGGRIENSGRASRSGVPLLLLFIVGLLNGVLAWKPGGIVEKVW